MFPLLSIAIGTGGQTGFESHWSSHTSDLKIDTSVATLPGAWRHRVSAGTGRSGVGIL